MKSVSMISDDEIKTIAGLILERNRKLKTLVGIHYTSIYLSDKRWKNDALFCRYDHWLEQKYIERIVVKFRSHGRRLKKLFSYNSEEIEADKHGE